MTNAPDAPGAPASTGRPLSGGFGLFLACAVAIGAFLAATVATRPVRALGVDAPADAFSAARAELVLRDLLREGVPHPVGSPANAVVRDRIVSHLRDLGLEPRVERHWVVAPSENVCAWVENVTARIPGTAPGPGVLLAAHYDSVGAGPGAADDAQGVATAIETARALRAGPALRRDVVLLLTDGEEAGLLGARAHVRAHGVDDIAAVVNVEARGTSGPSLMFETGPGTAATVPAWAANAARPLTSSLFASVYRELPNDTDLTVFREAGVPGLNFANVGRVQHYHTPLDSLANADIATLQHHGDNALGAVRGLASAETLAADAGEIAWFDVLGLVTVRWPAGGTMPLAVAAFLLVAAGVVVGVRRGATRVAAVALGFAAALAGLAAAVGLVFVVGWMLTKTPALPGAFVASPGGTLAAAAGLAAFVAGAVGVLVGGRAGPRGLWSGAWLLLAAGGAALAWIFPDAAWLLFVPAFAAGATDLLLAATPAGRRDGNGAWQIAALVPLGVACALWFPLVPLLTSALGFGAPVVPAAPFVLAALVFAPMVAAGGPKRWIVAAAGLLFAAVGVAAAVASPAHTPELPRRLDVTWARDAADRHAHWYVRCEGPVPPAMLAAHAFEDETERIVPWENRRGWPAEAPFLDLPGPALDDLQVRATGDSRRIRFQLTSRRGAPVTTLVISPTARLRRVSVGGSPVPPETLRVGLDGPFVIHCLTTPADGVAIELDVADTKPVDVYVSDQSPGLPPGADAILRSRPDDAAPRQDGDVTIVHRKLAI